MSDKEHFKGTAKKAEGEVQEAVGDLADDSSMKAKGKLKQAKGEARKTAGDIKDKFKD